MKKILMTLCVLAMTSWVANSQTTVSQKLTDTEVYYILENSKELNAANGISNLDSIFPGQPATFRYFNGNIVSIPVEKDDVMWKLAEKAQSYVPFFGPIVPFTDSTAKAEAKATAPIAPKVTNPPAANTNGNTLDLSNIPGWAWFLIVATLFLGAVGFGIWKARKDLYVNPVTAGPAFRPQGIQYGEENEHQTVTQEFQRQYGEPVTNIRRCLISTPNNQRYPVKFANDTTQDLILRKERGYEGQTANGQLRYILGPCANGFALRTHMTGEGLQIEYLDNVPAPTATTETPAQQQQGIQTLLVGVVSAAVEKMSNGGALQFEHEGVKLNIWVNEKPNVLINNPNGHTKEEKKTAAAEA